jgi:hypothetical protein
MSSPKDLVQAIGEQQKRAGLPMVKTDGLTSPWQDQYSLAARYA